MHISKLFISKIKIIATAAILWFALTLLELVGYFCMRAFDSTHVWKYFLLANGSTALYSLLVTVAWRNREHKTMMPLILLPFCYMFMVFVNFRHFMLTHYCCEIFHSVNTASILIFASLFLEKYARFMHWLRAVIEFVLYALIATVIVNVLVTGGCFNNEAVIAICQTHAEEASFYFWNIMHGAWFIACLAVAFIGIIYGIYHAHKAMQKTYPLSTWHKLLSLASMCMLVCLLFVGTKAYVFSDNVPLIGQALKAYKIYNDDIKRYNETVENRKKIVERAKSQIGKIEYEQPKGISVLIIGESLNRNYMSCYGYPIDTTPFQKSCSGKNNFYFFEKPYSCHVQTAQVVPLAITGINQYMNKNNNEQDIYKYMENATVEQDMFNLSLLDIAKEFGYKTIWISTQAKVNAQNSLISSIASQADKAIFLCEVPVYIQHYDIEIAEALAKMKIDDGTLIIIHLEGNHYPYGKRYPENFSFPFEMGLYEKSVYYNDYVIQNIFNVFKDKPLNFFAYFSDHSDAVTSGKGHDPRPEKFTMEMIEIPFWMYVSDSYADETMRRQLEASTSRVFTNDLTFNLMLDLMKLPQPEDQKIFSPLSQNYYLLTNTPLSLNGKLEIKNK